MGEGEGREGGDDERKRDRRVVKDIKRRKDREGGGTCQRNSWDTTLIPSQSKER